MSRSPDYEMKLLWNLNYPSKSWFSRRAALGGVLFVAGLVIALAGQSGAQGTAGWAVVICANAYFIYLLQIGYVRAKRGCAA